MVKNYATKLLCCLMLFVAVAANAQTSAVTFSVDMNQTAGVSANGVHMAGNFQDVDYDGVLENASLPNWDPSVITLTDADGNGVYEVTLDLVYNANYQFKFVNGNAWGTDESVPAECGTGNPTNRVLVVDANTTAYGPYLFASCELSTFTAGGTACATPVTLPGLGTYTTQQMTVTGGEVTAAATAALWYTVEAPQDGIMVVSSCGDDVNTFGFALVGNLDCAALSNADLLAVGGDISPTQTCSEMSFYCTAGTSYTIYWDNSQSSDPFTFTVDIRQQQPASVTFNVDLSKEAADNGALIAGSFNGWTPAAMTSVGNGIYTITLSLMEGDTFTYKFLNGDNGWEAGDLLADCGIQGGFGFDRAVVIPINGGTTIPYCFGKCSNCAPDNDACTAAVDLNQYIGQGVDVVQTTPTYSNVGASSEGDPTTGIDCFFAGTNEPGTQNTVWYSFTGDGNTYLIKTVPGANFLNIDTQVGVYSGDCDNLTAVICGEDVSGTDYSTTVEVVTVAGTTYYFFVDGYMYDDGSQAEGDFELQITQLTGGSVAQARAVTFKVDMSLAGSVSPEGVHIAGNFLDPNFDGTAENPAYANWDPAAIAMTNQGGNIWSVTLNLIDYNYEYKFINGNTWDTGGAQNSEQNISLDCSVASGNRSITVTADFTTINYCFEYCVTCANVGTEDIEFANSIALNPNPTTGIAFVAYNFNKSADLDIRVMNSLGQLVHNATVANAQNGNLELNLTNVAAGMYFVQISNGESFATKRLIIE